MKIAGIDPSIKSSGIVVMDLDDNLEVKDIQFYGYTTTKMYAVDEGNVHIAYLCAPDKYSALCMPERQRLTYDIISKCLDGFCQRRRTSSSRACIRYCKTCPKPDSLQYWICHAG